MKETLLNTKLHIPAVRTELVARPALITRLNAAAISSRLILLSAPAGYGKTTLLSAWLAQCERPAAWYSLDESDNDLSSFLTYLLAAVQQIYPLLGESVLSLLKMPPMPPVQTLAAWLINDLAEVPFDFVLILEDYHVIHQPLLHELVTFMLEHQPPNLLLVIAGRQDPPFSLSRLRVRGQMGEIRADDLRFNDEEAASFFNYSMSLSLQESTVRKLALRTEGWIAGLQLAALSMQGWDALRIETFVENFGGSHRYVIDYLLDEVIEKQPQAIRDFLYQSAFLERLSAPLCDALLARSDSHKVLFELERANLFLVPLDDERRWYRYHHLFADSLRAGGQIEPAQLRALHLRAAHWFEDNDWQAEAIRHYLEAQEMQLAARLIAAAADNLIRSGELVTLLGWLNLLPEERVLQDHNLAAARTTALLLTADFKAAGVYIERWQQVDPDKERGKRLALLAWLAEFGGSEGVLQLATRALQHLSEEEGFYRMLALIMLGSARRALSDIPAANAALQQAGMLGRQLGYPLGELGALVNLAFNLIEQGELREARVLCEEAMLYHVDRKGRPLPVLGMVYIPYAQVLFLENDLSHAQEYARRGLLLCRQLFSSIIMGGDAEAVLALSAMVEGRVQEAFEITESTHLAALQKSLIPLAGKMELLKAMLALRCNDLAAVQIWLSGNPTALHASEPGLILQARFYLQQRQSESAMRILNGLEQTLVQTGKRGRLLQVQLLFAWACEIEGDLPRALNYLNAALRLAHAQGYRRAFYDLLPYIAALLPQARSTFPTLVDDLLAACAGLPGRPLCDKPQKSGAVPQLVEALKLVEALSERELEILNCIHEGLTNDEIAARLVITQGTVKWHVSNIYGKLGVKNRTQAVARARQLSLII